MRRSEAEAKEWLQKVIADEIAALSALRFVGAGKSFDAGAHDGAVKTLKNFERFWDGRRAW